MTGISEAASEKRGRGRPKLFDGLDPSTFCPGKGRRQAQNLAYAAIAQECLTDDEQAGLEPEFRWLSDGPEGKVYRSAILAELGRIGDPDIIRELARTLCKNKPKAKDAIADICRWRLGQEKSTGNQEQLIKEICRTIDSYLVRHRAMRDEDVREALSKVGQLFECEGEG